VTEDRFTQHVVLVVKTSCRCDLPDEAAFPDLLNYLSKATVVPEKMFDALEFGY